MARVLGSLPERVLRRRRQRPASARDAGRRRCWQLACGRSTPAAAGRMVLRGFMPNWPSAGVAVSRKRVGAIDARRGCGRCQPTPGASHDAPRRACAPARSGSGRAPLRGRRAESPVGCRHHVCADAGGSSSTWPSSSTRSAGGSWAGQWQPTCAQSWSSKRWSMAVTQTPAGPRQGSIILDRGSQYTSLAFGARCRASGVVRSMGSAGDCFDNSMAESFFATLECELARPHHPVEPRRGACGRVRFRRRVVQHAAAPFGSGLQVAIGIRTTPCTPRGSVSGLWTPFRCPRVRWIPRCARASTPPTGSDAL